MEPCGRSYERRAARGNAHTKRTGSRGALAEMPALLDAFAAVLDPLDDIATENLESAVVTQIYPRYSIICRSWTPPDTDRLDLE
jgi:hypothetical protein